MYIGLGHGKKRECEWRRYSNLNKKGSGKLIDPLTLNGTMLLSISGYWSFGWMSSMREELSRSIALFSMYRKESSDFYFLLLLSWVYFLFFFFLFTFFPFTYRGKTFNPSEPFLQAVRVVDNEVNYANCSLLLSLNLFSALSSPSNTRWNHKAFTGISRFLLITFFYNIIKFLFKITVPRLAHSLFQSNWMTWLRKLITESSNENTKECKWK